ncbi:MAG: hypothetical protein L6Q99_18995 [Planctomycetes bacterium]|nr:hypothetical protein [Planctomycetota bacterium]
MLPELERSLARLLSRAKTAAWLEASAQLLAPVLFALGAWVLLARFGLGESRTSAAWALFALLAVPLAAWFVARRRFLSPQAALVWLDRESGGSGALLTQAAIGDPRWNDAAERALATIARLPRLAPGKAFVPSLLAAAFVAGAFVLERSALPAPPATAVIEQRVDAVQADLAALAEIVELSAETTEELEARLERVEAGPGDAPLDANLEAVDRTEEALAREADEALAAADRARDGLDLAAAADSEEAARAALNEALRELKDAGLAAKLPKELLAKLDPGSLELPDGVQLSREELGELSNALREALDARMERLAKAGLLSKNKLERYRELERIAQHVCDETCKRGGT